jgi:opine dehydrogenase
MNTVTVLGAGAGGAAACADLSQRGYAVRLWNRSPPTLEPFAAAGGVAYEGVLGEGRVRPQVITADLGEALAGADAAVVCLPALGHESLARALAAAPVTVPIVLNPGHTGGALHFRAVFRAAGVRLPPLAELSTLTYVARKYRPDRVTVSGAAERVHGACLPGGDEALVTACELFPATAPADDVLATDLANVNLILHPPGAILSAAWVEATGGDFLFYAQGVTPGVARVIGGLDRERLAVAASFGHVLPPLHEEMAAIGTAERTAAARGELAAAIRDGAANRRIRAPDSLAHRYYTEDFGYGVLPFLVLAAVAGVETPIAAALLRLAETLLGTDLASTGLDAGRLGIEGLRRDELAGLVGSRAAA